MHCPRHDAATSLIASSSGRRIGPGFCNTRNLIVKGSCVFEIPVGGLWSVWEVSPPHIHNQKVQQGNGRVVHERRKKEMEDSGAGKNRCVREEVVIPDWEDRRSDLGQHRF